MYRLRNKFTSLTTLCLVILLIASSMTSSCSKTETIESTIDSIKITKSQMVGKWNVQHLERYMYSGGTFVGNQIEYYNGTNTYTEYKSDLTYTSMYKGAAAGSGTWEIISPSYMVLDKGNPSQERYYYIIALDNKVQITHGPFKSDGTLFIPNELYYFYSSK